MLSKEYEFEIMVSFYEGFFEANKDNPFVTARKEEIRQWLFNTYRTEILKKTLDNLLK